MSTAVVLRCTPRRRYTALARYATCQAIRTLLNRCPLRNRTPVLGTNYLELELPGFFFFPQKGSTSLKP